MAKIFDFENFKQKREEPSAPEQESALKEGLQPMEGRKDLRRELTQEEFVEIVELLRLTLSVVLNPGKMKAQRKLVSEWSDEEFLAFVRNPQNRQMMRQRPHLINAVYERLTGRI